MKKQIICLLSALIFIIASSFPVRAQAEESLQSKEYTNNFDNISSSDQHINGLSNPITIEAQDGWTYPGGTGAGPWRLQITACFQYNITSSWTEWVDHNVILYEQGAYIVSQSHSCSGNWAQATATVQSSYGRYRMTITLRCSANGHVTRDPVIITMVN